MNKAQLIASLALKFGSKAAAERAINAVLGGIQLGLKKEKEVSLVGFGLFFVRERKARRGRNPKTGAPIRIKRSRTVAFKAGEILKKSV